MPDTATHPPNLTLDLERYRPFLEGSDASEEEKQALLEALWSIIASFVRLGWGVDAVSDVLAAREIPCGKLSEIGAGGPDTGRDMVELKGLNNPRTFNHAADVPSQKASAP